jgi:hypothetical protein
MDTVRWADVVELGRRAARHFKLRRAATLRIEPMRPLRRTRADGRCWPYLGRIVLRVHRVGRPRQSLRHSTVMAALAHELAHLPGYGHDAKHGDLTRRIAAWLREQRQPVAHKLFDGVGRDPRKPRQTRFSYSWKRPKPRRRVR